MTTPLLLRIGLFSLLLIDCAASFAADPKPPDLRPNSGSTLADLTTAIRRKASASEASTGMRSSFQSFISAYKLAPDSISYSDYVVARLLYEASRDAGLWNLHWAITNRDPNSDHIWRQWQNANRVSTLVPTATAECDELSALYAFLARREGIHGVGLLWPYPNHTVAVWVLRPHSGPALRIVVPTTQIFLEVTDSFATRKFDPWRQKNIFEYTRRDVSDSFTLPKPLFDFFLSQLEKYAGASDSTLQQLRYLREGVFLKYWTAEDAAHDALRRRNESPLALAEDLAAFENFAHDMRSGNPGPLTHP